ncbi:hypothetical protein K491DRAFT_681253 [Lophiostoma macrostomum CBS 122681]|uniref:Uncharacterized protein n=1 Tax=Lophiostoma macrostomum CBS 122681 TaxID=1314788 RepID=A0A6A6SYA7_9PLEO|nr:hypothetical protein K491DRAFT_681253 [Lophiostoma macrostomum CBS 122681]
MSYPTTNRPANDVVSEQQDQSDTRSVDSFDFIPEPHNWAASINGPPIGHPDYAAWHQSQQSGNTAPPQTAGHVLNSAAAVVQPVLNPSAISFVPHVVVPSTAAQKEATFRALVDKLLHPPHRPNDRDGFVTIEWPFVIQTIQEPQFKDWADDIPYKQNISRRELVSGSDLDVLGARFGMPEEYLQWLRGNSHNKNILSIPRARLHGGN